MKLRNNSGAPRVFNVKGGAPGVAVQKIVAPGAVEDLDLLVGPDQDPVLKAWIESKEVEEAQDGEPPPVASAAEQLAQAEAKAAESAAEVTRLRSLVQTAELDGLRMTPPRQLATDGGPQQVPTLGATPGAMTPSQEEQGRQEPASLTQTVAVPNTTPLPSMQEPPKPNPAKPPPPKKG